MTNIRKPSIFVPPPPPPKVSAPVVQARPATAAAVQPSSASRAGDAFVAVPPSREKRLDEGALRRGPELDPRVREGVGMSVHQLMLSGAGSGRPLALGGFGAKDIQQSDVQQVATPTPVGMQPAMADPRTEPLPLNDLIQQPALAEALITQWRGSGDAQLARYADTLERAVGNPIYQEWAARTDPPSIVLTTSEGNGGEPVMLLVPPDFAANPAMPRPVHTHYHGVGLPVAGDRDDAGNTAAIDGIWNSTHPDPIFVLPEARTVTSDDEIGSNGGWRLNGTINVADTTHDALEVAYAGTGVEPAITERIVSAHSRGGAALALSVRNDPDSLQADRLLLLDCLITANVAPEGAPDSLVDVDMALAEWVDGRARAGEPVPAMVFYQQSTGDGPLPAAMQAAGARYEVLPRADHMALNAEGMASVYPRNQPGPGTPTPTPGLTGTPAPTP